MKDLELFPGLPPRSLLKGKQGPSWTCSLCDQTLNKHIKKLTEFIFNTKLRIRKDTQTQSVWVICISDRVPLSPKTNLSFFMQMHI